MGVDTSWVTLSLWPWKDGYLGADDELRAALDEHGAVENGEAAHLHTLCGFYEGTVDAEPLERRRDGAVKVTITGQLSGGSSSLYNDGLFEMFRDRGIAYEMYGDSAFEWDGDMEFWTPAMAEPFNAPWSQHSGRLLTESTYADMQVRCSPIGNRIEVARGELASALNLLAQYELELHSADLLHREIKGTTYGSGAWLFASWRQDNVDAWRGILQKRRLALHRLVTYEPPPADLAELLTSFFEATPDWMPSRKYQPKIEEQEVANA